ncbi:hypothetical protein R1sor_000915 [Riccia sorocarpa]|uniref:glutathione transferase n=1 Tax=Riccia sorocarpa TaxID=122646 RepID=A0ABD3GUI8_9MARC
MTIKLHGSAMSTCTGRVLITLFEKEVQDYELVDLSKGEHKSPEFLKHQPFGQIPYLVHGDLELFESRAIARGVADCIVFQIVFAPMFGKNSDEAVVAAETAKLESVLDIYEERLSEKKYLAGDFFSLADLSHITYSYYLIKLAGKGAIYDSRPHVKAWIEGVFARPATQKWLKLAGFAQ